MSTMVSPTTLQTLGITRPASDLSPACYPNHRTLKLAPPMSHSSLQAMAHSTFLRTIQTSCTCHSTATTCELLHLTSLARLLCLQQMSRTAPWMTQQCCALHAL